MNNMTEDEFFYKAFSSSVLSNINDSYYLSVFTGLSANTAYTFFAKATDSDGLTKYVAHTMSTKEQGNIVIPAAGAYVMKHPLRKKFNVSILKPVKETAELKKENVELAQIR